MLIVSQVGAGGGARSEGADEEAGALAAGEEPESACHALEDGRGGADGGARADVAADVGRPRAEAAGVAPRAQAPPGPRTTGFDAIDASSWRAFNHASEPARRRV